MTDPTDLSAIDIAACVRERTLSPVEVIDAFISAVERRNPELLAYVTVCGERARAEARSLEARLSRGESVGPLAGVPVSIKDTLPTVGVRTTAGSNLFPSYVPEADATCIARLRAAGAVVLGKTACSELGVYGEGTYSLLWPETRNPRKLDRTPGGSSGGAAAAVAANLGPIALGTDEGGSVRIPAHLCGVVGFKPSFGRVPRGPLWLPHLAATSGLLGHIGPIARTVADAALAVEVLAGPDRADPASQGLPPIESLVAECHSDKKAARLHVAFSPNLGFARVDAGVAELVGRAAKHLEHLGHHVEIVQALDEDPHPFTATLNLALHHELLSERVRKIKVTPRLEKWTAPDTLPSDSELREARAGLRRANERLRALFNRYDLLLCPVAAVTAFALGAPDGPPSVGEKPAKGLDWMPFTVPFNALGLPAISIPCGIDRDGLPCGLQIVGGPSADLSVLRGAAEFERTYPVA